MWDGSAFQVTAETPLESYPMVTPNAQMKQDNWRFSTSILLGRLYLKNGRSTVIVEGYKEVVGAYVIYRMAPFSMTLSDRFVYLISDVVPCWNKIILGRSTDGGGSGLKLFKIILF